MTNLNRRQFMVMGGVGAATLAGSMTLTAASAKSPSPDHGPGTRGYVAPGINDPDSAGRKHMALVTTDGWVSMPRDSDPVSPWFPDVLAPGDTNTFVFGFRNVTGLSRDQAEAQRGVVQISAPFVHVQAGQELWLTMSNLGLSMRPDLVDSHTVHWHGFRNAIPFYDGVPESSISVNIGRDFTYVFKPTDPGTYMYHCHFEDVEHVTMGMTGIVFVTPADGSKTVYGLGPTVIDSTTGATITIPDGTYAREYAILLTEMDSRAHFGDAHIQPTDWTDFAPNFWLMNGRAYPDTIAPNGEDGVHNDGTPVAAAGFGHLAHQPMSSRIVCAPGERVLVRLANLGFQEQSLTLPGIPMTIVGKDARPLTTDEVEITDTIQIGPGESRDVIIVAPAKVGQYPLFNRDMAKYPGSSITGDQFHGGQRTVVDVQAALPAQTEVNGW